MPFCVAKSPDLPVRELLEGVQSGIDVVLAQCLELSCRKLLAGERCQHAAFDHSLADVFKRKFGFAERCEVACKCAEEGVACTCWVSDFV